jgi:hypothetical protein
MKNVHAAALAATALLALPALAHQPDIPAALLSESDWRDIMRGLDKHYGDNADLGEETRKKIEEFLAHNAEPHWKAHFPSGDPPRLTSTLWYRVHHHELPDEAWKDKRVGSASNCAACHPKAEKQLFDKTDLTDVPADYIGKTELRPPVYIP